MAWHVDLSKDFIVGGNDNTRLSPNFRLREFRRSNGAIKVHLELVSDLQILRSFYGSSISVTDISEDGLSAIINAANLTRLTEVCEQINSKKLFDTIEPSENGLRLTIHDPQQLQPIALTDALETAFSVTSSFETSGDRFQQVTGNFDGAGLSFGPAQWNFKSGTLTPLLRKFQKKDPVAFADCFSDVDDLAELLDVLEHPTSQQIRWGNNISTGRSNADVIEPWKSYFRALGRNDAYKAIMVAEALRKYGKKALSEIEYLESLSPETPITGLREVCSIYDLVIQQGSLKKAKSNIEERVNRERPNSQSELIKIAVEERGKKASAPYRTDCISRRLGILYGRPTDVEGKVRANTHFYLLRNVNIADPESARNKQVTTLLSAVGKNIATGTAIFA